jgi:hypothetical protein
MRLIVTCGLSGYYGIFPRYLINDMIFEKEVIENKMYFDFLYNVCLKYSSF